MAGGFLFDLKNLALRARLKIIRFSFANKALKIRSTKSEIRNNIK
jgi:hypothetical protein